MAEKRRQSLVFQNVTPLHLGSENYDLAGFKAGRMSLRPHEIADLGDVRGKDLVHLQCHFGLDTLSWARLGARVTGVDFSAPAVIAASEIATEIGVEARFLLADVYDAVSVAGAGCFDIVYTGVGALCWLPDIRRWARVVHDLLRPGGELYLFEFHPLRWMLLGAAPDDVAVLDGYFSPPEGDREGGVAYADTSLAAEATPTLHWNHSLGAIVTALVEAGMRIGSLFEMDIDGLMVPAGDGMYRMPPDRPSLPLMFMLRARRPETG